MTPEREAQMRGLFEKWRKDLFGNPDLTKDSEGYYEDWDTQVAWSGFLACARALEPMVVDGDLYQWLRSQYLAVDFDYEGECVLVFKIPQNTRVRADLDVTIKAAMSAALEDGNATE